MPVFFFSDGIDHGLRLRAALVHMKEQLDVGHWEETASASMWHVWYRPARNKLTTHA